MRDQPLPNAGVRFPPPLIYLLTLVAAYGANRARPLWLIAPEPRWMFLLGLALIAAGILVAIAGIVTFRRFRTAIVPFHPATMIVQSGPYAFTRNPMYLGLAIQYVGASLLLDTWWAFILLPVMLAIVDRAVIAREERYLTSAFGEVYTAYCTRVRRWI
jgi:protein-S-isoprenylcysteine O-methyltransferase Ste14